MNEYLASLMLVATLYGTVIIASPSVVGQLGILSYTLILFSLFAFNMFCYLLENDVFVDILTKQGKITDQISREPMKFFASEVYGKCFGDFVTFLQMLLNFLCSTGQLLLSATLFQSIIPIHGISITNQIRLYAVILSVAMVFPSQRGTYKEFGVMIWVAFGLAIFSEVCLLISVCMVRYYDIDKNIFSKLHREENVEPSLKELIQCIGEISYFQAMTMVLPNITVAVTNIKRLRFTIISSTVALFILYLTAGIIPYVCLKGYPIESSIFDTLAILAKELKSNDVSYWLNKFMVLCSVGMALHLLLVVSITMNPVFLYTEEKLHIPMNFGWQRFLTRCFLLASVCTLCVIFPDFSPVISWIGGLPLMFLAWIIPMLLYFKKFETPIYLKLFCILLSVVFIALMFSVNLVDLYLLL